MNLQIKTLSDLVFKTIPGWNKSACLMVKRDGAYQGISSMEVLDTIEKLSARLISMGIEKGDRVGILSENRPEWAFSDLAIVCAGAVSVPIYSTLPAKQIEYIINNSGMKTLFVSTQSQLKKILDIRDTIPSVTDIVLFEEEVDLPSGIKTFSKAIQEGTEVRQKQPQLVRERSAAIQPDDVFTFVYTSGTTGEPKGVMLTHKNIISNIEGIQGSFQFKPDDIMISFLPLSHIFERMAGYYTMLHEGCTIAYAENLDQMPKNLLEVRPTIFISVPRVYEKFYSRIMDNVAAETGLKKKLASWALRTAARYSERKLNRENLSPWLKINYAIADGLVLKKIRARLGGKIRLALSGGAALPRHLGNFFYGLGVTILEGYGLTETSPVITVNRPGAFKFGTVGPSIPGVEVKIAADGEILTRGPHVMKGYYQKPKESAEVISPEGWFHTGDIGEIDPDGHLKITDRKKDLIVTSAGKNIAPQFVENALKLSRYVSQIVVIGEKRKFPSALIVPNFPNLKKFAGEKRIPESELLTHPEIYAEILKDLDSLSQDLASFERVKKIVLLEKEFSIENGDLTPSLKVKRNVVEKKNQQIIDRLYADAT